MSATSRSGQPSRELAGRSVSRILRIKTQRRLSHEKLAELVGEWSATRN